MDRRRSLRLRYVGRVLEGVGVVDILYSARERHVGVAFVVVVVVCRLRRRRRLNGQSHRREQSRHRRYCRRRTIYRATRACLALSRQNPRASTSDLYD